ncbi:MAG: phosphoribosylglycinamide formyltransferase [Phenylobacterium sp.]|uniref:phosphoribosylglycinamide formyltransferase n=1 Tax=Phenylobacterium sp. TaxID=1871053 RepID=UPI00273562EC|nr:phosphoribosylglycinamide formyltransferase [Phenylobacterium sp.]MDP3173036.1 phosphoribosylglycinamide formyltransferase [Phenylobacterium sp.]
MTAQHLNLGFLASRNGSSARAVIAAIESGRLDASARLVVSNNRTSPLLAFAEAHAIPTQCIATQADPEAADARLSEALQAAGVELVVLSGYLRQLGPKVLSAYRNRVLNIHPGPLPRFGGHGMYGRHVHEAVIAAGVAESGACILVVDEEYDHGPVIARHAVPVETGDTAQMLEARVTAAEPGFFVQTLQRIAQGELTLPG